MKKHNDLFLTRLRKSSAVLAVLCWFAAMETGAAQGTADGYLYVYPLAQSAQPSSGNATLAPIFQQYQVVSYVKSFPGAQAPSLQNAYEIHCNGDVVALATALQGSGLFSLVELEPYYQLAGGSGDCGTSCSNPLTVNDPGVRYELALTQAPCAWNITQGSPSVVVAVVDSYFDQSNLTWRVNLCRSRVRPAPWSAMSMGQQSPV